MNEIQRVEQMGGRRFGVQRIGDHEIFSVHHGDEWHVIVNGRSVDSHHNKFDALDVVKNLTEALQVPIMSAPNVCGEGLECVRCNGTE